MFLVGFLVGVIIGFGCCLFIAIMGEEEEDFNYYE